MAYAKYYDQWVDAVYDSNGVLLTPSTTPFTAATATHWDNAHAQALPQTAKGDLVGYTGSATVKVPLGATDAALVVDPAQTSGLRWSTTTYVPSSQRTPLGGVTTISYASTITPNATTSTGGKVAAAGNVTVNPPSGGGDGTLYLLVVTATGANRTVTMASGIVLTTGTTRAFTVTAAERGYFGLRYNSETSTWALLSQTQTITG